MPASMAATASGASGLLMSTPATSPTKTGWIGRIESGMWVLVGRVGHFPVSAQAMIETTRVVPGGRRRRALCWPEAEGSFLLRLLGSEGSRRPRSDGGYARFKDEGAARS